MSKWLGVGVGVGGGEERSKIVWVDSLEGKRFLIYVCYSQNDTVIKELDNLTFLSDYTLILSTSFINSPCSLFTASKSSRLCKPVFPSSVLFVSCWNSICDYSRHGTFVQCRKYGEKWALYFEAFLYSYQVFFSLIALFSLYNYYFDIFQTSLHEETFDSVQRLLCVVLSYKPWENMKV
jgi:hypothetical protein